MLTACGSSHKGTVDAGADAAAACTAGEMHCNGNELQTCVGGQFQDSQSCPNMCDDVYGCVVCVPNTGTCNGDTSHACNSTGTGYDDVQCDPVQGVTCDPGSGLCSGACAPQAIGSSYIGCEYYPTVTGNMVGPDFGFALAIANTSASDATVTIEDGGLTSPMTVTVAAGSVQVQTLPWQADLKLCLGTGFDWSPCSGGTGNANLHPAALVSKGAFHLRSTAPVTVYQFNPINYTDGANFSYTNDASLLLPTNVWRTDYYAASWQNTAGVNPDEFAVTASQDGTAVTITTKADTTAYGGAPAFATGVPQTVMLDAGDTIEVSSYTGDLTGSEVSSDKPVQLISGHYCADVPDSVCCCDHIEESMFSVDALGNSYIVNAPAVPEIPTGRVEYIRIIGTVGNTNLSYDPPQAGAPTTIANPGDFVEIADNANSFQITADHKILVAQYMEGQLVDNSSSGDPAMALAVPSEQFRTSYLFHAPTNYTSNFVDITAPDAAIVMLDGTMVTGFTPIGTTGFSVARIASLGGGPNADGTHSITGSMPFGITVYGYGEYTSYWYAGGLDLTDIPVN